MADDKTKKPDEQKDGDNMIDDKTKKPDEQKDGGNVTDDKKKHKHERKHEKRIPHRVNFNNIDLSHHAEHDWQTEHKKRREEKMKKRATREDGYDDINIWVHFQKLDRTGVTACGPDEGENVTYEWLPSNHIAFVNDPLTPTPISPVPDGWDEATSSVYIEDFYGGDSAMNLLARVMADYPDGFVCDPEPSDISPDPNVPPEPLYYVSNIEIAGEPYNITTESETDPNPGYTPNPDTDPDNPPYPDGEDVDWLGLAWMFFDGPSRAPDWDPDDNDPWTPGSAGFKPDGKDEYPNGTLDEYHPIQEWLAWTIDLNGDYHITFSYERQCFDFIYEGHEDENGKKHMELVIRPMRLHKKPVDEPGTTEDETKDDKTKDDETKDDKAKDDETKDDV
jgi:hypothetical protein